ncbi:CPBP family intramembrane metalloprotease [Caenimonas koreensis DSM 17982]|uniref:CPBP family intramembrane metalloprotease n=1 Tax=Caenimonas koreensis DSM 17982 TaxID=1121255 RepID=A0A844B560_9BURK|nr:CPBP family intramembrane glutamic endopeptidase [Caenimonas koreensis]MRD48342.1 CPBP family intramembrane metalloprotease [Caenimonas koreensis DSM 17982]
MNTIAYQTPADARKWKRRLVYSPLARIVIFLLMAAAALAMLTVGARLMGLDVRGTPVNPQSLSILVRQLVPFVGAYWILVYFIEKRTPVELAWRKVVPHGLAGIFFGAAFIAATIGVMWLAGSYVVTGTQDDVDWVKPLLVVGLGAAVSEEIVFRGVIFRIAEEGLGTWPALAISALFFGGVHIMNPGATVWSSFAIAVEAGVLLGLVYHLTRSLPLVMGIHMAWNFVQGTVFGVPVSGGAAKGWLISTRPGNEWLSGGAFGAEASVVAVALSLVASAWMLNYAYRHRTIFVRRWRSNKTIEATAP